MTNILDTVEPDAWLFDGQGKYVHKTFASINPGEHQTRPADNGIVWTKSSLYSRETLEPAIKRLLVEHRKQVLLEAGFSHIGEGRTAKRKEARDAIYAECLSIIEKYGMKGDVIYKEIYSRMAEGEGN